MRDDRSGLLFEPITLVLENAYDLYKQALAIAPTNRRARGQLNEIAEFYVDKTRRFTRSGNIASASNNLAVLENFFPKHVEIANLKTAT